MLEGGRRPPRRSRVANEPEPAVRNIFPQIDGNRLSLAAPCSNTARIGAGVIDEAEDRQAELSHGPSDRMRLSMLSPRLRHAEITGHILLVSRPFLVGQASTTGWSPILPMPPTSAMSFRGPTAVPPMQFSHSSLMTWM